MSETVYISSGTMNGGRVYHTDRDCKALQHPDATNIKKKAKDAINPDFEICDICNGTKTNRGSGNKEYYRAAINHGKANE